MDRNQKSSWGGGGYNRWRPGERHGMNLMQSKNCLGTWCLIQLSSSPLVTSRPNPIPAAQVNNSGQAEFIPVPIGTKPCIPFRQGKSAQMRTNYNLHHACRFCMCIPLKLCYAFRSRMQEEIVDNGKVRKKRCLSGGAALPAPSR